ncbi:MAG: guanine deaminase [bacterium]|nr:guanine deaminase [bacterium]
MIGSTGTALTAVVASVLDAPTRGELRVRHEALVTVDQAGIIVSVLDPSDSEYEQLRDRFARNGHLTELEEGQFLLPGLIDLHNHAPQWPQLGKALDVPLEVWLNRYTFPLEAKYADLGFAGEVYESLVDSMIGNGTTTAVYFATTHLPATKLLVDLCIEKGQRALVGKVAMDDPDGCPDFYRDESAATAIAATAELIDYVESHPGNRDGLVLPAITPRFIPSCTDELMAGLGELATHSSAHIQTHCSESDWAHSYGVSRFGQTDTATYRDFGLLTSKTVLAHSNFVNAQDLAMIADAGAAVAHCPLSNVYFANAVFPTRDAFAADVHIGLGTDVSGGPGPSVFSAAASAVAASRVREDGVDPIVTADERGVPDSRISFAEAFWMATTGGGEALRLPIGVLSPGYSFDAIAIDTAVPETDLNIWPDIDSSLDVLQKIINNTVRRNVSRVWIQGVLVKSPSR